MTTAAYIRVSSVEQDYERQRRQIAESWDVDEWFEDVGSGTVPDREAYEHLLASADQWDDVVFTELTRLGRSVQQGIDAAEQLRSSGCTIHLMDDGLTLRPDGDRTSDLIFNILLSIAEWEAEAIQTRTQEAIEIRQSEGAWTGRPPIGYTTQDRSDGIGRTLVRDEVEYEILRRAIRALRRGHSKSDVAREFGIARSTLNSVIDRANGDSDLYPDLSLDEQAWRETRARVDDLGEISSGDFHSSEDLS